MTDDANKMLEQRWRALRGEEKLEDDRRDGHSGGEASAVLFSVSHYLGHLLDTTRVGGMKGTTVVWQE